MIVHAYSHGLAIHLVAEFLDEIIIYTTQIIAIQMMKKNRNKGSRHRQL